MSALLRRGMRVAVADGVGAPLTLLAELSDAASAVGDIDLVLAWAPAPLDGLDIDAFASVRTTMAGYGLRRDVDRGAVAYLPSRLGHAPALFAGSLRPDVLVAGLVPGASGHTFGTEVAWLRSCVDAGSRVVAVERPNVPGLDVGPPLPAEQLTLVGTDPSPPTVMPWGAPADVHRAVAAHVVPLIPEGARVQYGPGPVGTAVLDALTVPVHVDTGMVTDAVCDLDRRGLLLGRPLAPYVAGRAELYEWAEGRVDVDRVEVTHDQGRLAADPPLVAVNTALEIDLDGQVNVEAVGDSAVAGIGGQPDYAAGAARSVHGLSIVAVPTHRGPHRTLVEWLAAPTTTPSHDIDVVVTEHGAADLRTLSRAERRAAILALWNP